MTTFKNTVHRTDDWTKTACGVDVDNALGHDDVIATGRHPREYAPGYWPCAECFPREALRVSPGGGEQRMSPEGDIVTVRGVRDAWIDFSYIGPPGKNGVYPADASGRSSEHERAFRALFPHKWYP